MMTTDSLVRIITDSKVFSGKVVQMHHALDEESRTLGVPVAAGVLSPIIAVAAMSFSSVSVIVNSLRLKKMKL